MFVDLPGESWRPIDGYDGLYEVSNRGRVRSWSTRGSHLRIPATKPHLVSIEVNRRGACSVTLQRGRDHHRRGVLVHHLVMAAFIGPRQKGQLIRHLDGNAQNNRLENLSYGTQADNMADALRHGTTARGNKLPQAKLDDEKVMDIRRRFSAGETIKTLALEYGVSWASCQDVVLGVSWRHVGNFK